MIESFKFKFYEQIRTRNHLFFSFHSYGLGPLLVKCLFGARQLFDQCGPHTIERLTLTKHRTWRAENSNTILIDQWIPLFTNIIIGVTTLPSIVCLNWFLEWRVKILILTPYIRFKLNIFPSNIFRLIRKNAEKEREKMLI